MCACGTVQCVLLTFRHTNLCVRTGFCLCICKPIWLKEQSTQNRNFVHFPITASQDPFDIFSSGAIRGFQFNNNTQSKGTIFIYHFWQEKNKTKLQFPYCFCCVIQVSRSIGTPIEADQDCTCWSYLHSWGCCRYSGWKQGIKLSDWTEVYLR